MVYDTFAGVLRDFEIYLLTKVQRSRQTSAQRADDVGRLLRTVSSLDPTLAEINTYKRDLLLKGRRPRYVQNIVFATKDYLTWRGRTEDAAALVVPKGGGKPLPKYLTTAEVRAFLSVVRGVQRRALYYFLAYTGLRIHEVLKATLLDINLAEKTVRVLGKGGKHTTCFIGEPAISVLREWIAMRDTSYATLFYTTKGPRKGEPIQYPNVQKMTERLGRLAAIPHRVSPHQFRHAMGTGIIENGGSGALQVAQRQLRHSDIKTTMVYLHLGDKTFKENFERFQPSFG